MKWKIEVDIFKLVIVPIGFQFLKKKKEEKKRRKKKEEKKKRKKRGIQLEGGGGAIEASFTL